MLRKFFIWLSRLNWAQRLITKSKIASRMVLRFVAGESIDDAVEVIRILNQQGLLATVDFLGEDTHTSADADDATQEIIGALEAIQKTELRCNVSLKLSQLGLMLDEQICRTNLSMILNKAAALGNFVRIDMEDSSLTDVSLTILSWAVEQGFSNVGIVLQSYLYRTADDIQTMPIKGMTFRLCKGAYNEPATVAFPQKTDVDANFDKIVKLLFERSKALNFPCLSESGRYPSIPGIATHDEVRIQNAIQLMEEFQMPRDAMEFQMLYGIRRELQMELVEQKYQVRVYVPYGTHWYRYFMRRLAERPANIWFIVSNFFKK
ncbi:MAG: proline dehydrogenase family protein [Anaerolineaceae bacterium]|nr:proline dehydrogenase family protein [Anaerolineaceae bacterium]